MIGSDHATYTFEEKQTPKIHMGYTFRADRSTDNAPFNF